ncbi:MAG: phosphatase PAP2 family protein [Clostridiaceae bacterium]|nr:phosphatase PAP2 family protein [Clostridiaceae bacterium]
MKIINLMKKYKHIVLILYLPIYLYCFAWLEKRDDVPFTTIHCFIDDWIPFCEVFIIPYLLWFVYVVAVLLFLFFQTDHLEDYYRCAGMLILGMSTCLLIYYIFPNAQNMRPDGFARSNVFTDIMSFVYAADTDTNVLPSIHVYNAIVIHMGFSTSHRFREKPGWKYASLTLCVLICLSTMFLKQHSVLDVISAILLFGLYYALVCSVIPDWRRRHNGKAQYLPLKR